MLILLDFAKALSWNIHCSVLRSYMKLPLVFFLILFLLDFVKNFSIVEHSFLCFGLVCETSFVSFLLLILIGFAKAFSALE